MLQSAMVWHASAVDADGRELRVTGHAVAATTKSGNPRLVRAG
jgi:hypothetical protein